MMDLAIETIHLSKSYRDVHAVRQVNLRVKPGELYGFLGLNGAGKTTTIRAVLGMVRPSAGSVRILGQAIGPSGRGPWARVGHLVESPAAYPELSVRENLEIARRLQRIKDAAATWRAIQRLGLDPYADRQAGTLSTGNLQRLGLARALLHEPEVLILDEPANGLDPAGVVEIRNLLAALVREQGITVFMSSHILTEVDRLATRIGIIHQGKLIEELDTDALERLRSKRLEVQARDLGAAQVSLRAAGYSFSLTGGTLVMEDPRAVDCPEEVAVLMTRAGCPPTRLAVQQQDLEEHFLQLIRAQE